MEKDYKDFLIELHEATSNPLEFCKKIEPDFHLKIESLKDANSFVCAWFESRSRYLLKEGN